MVNEVSCSRTCEYKENLSLLICSYSLAIIHRLASTLNRLGLPCMVCNT